MRDTGLTRAYDWLVVTRSDFLWRVPHPRVEVLSDRRIYVLDGEEYGGVEDRHIVVPPANSSTGPEPDRPDLHRSGLAEAVSRSPQRDARVGVPQHRALRRGTPQAVGLWPRVRHLPYVPYWSERPAARRLWSVGEFHQEHGYYVKYPSEFDRSEISRPFVPDQAAWGRYLAPVRGARMRWQLQRACREADREAGREMDLYQRPFPLRKAPLRGARLLRWGLLRGAGRIRTELVPAIGYAAPARFRYARAARRADSENAAPRAALVTPPSTRVPRSIRCWLRRCPLSKVPGCLRPRSATASSASSPTSAIPTCAT